MKIVSKVKVTNDIKKDVLKAINLAGGFNIKKGDVVLLKPNYVDDVPYPATTSPDMLKAVVELLFFYGAGKVIIGESSYHDTREVMTNQGALKVAEETGADFYVFDEHDWVEKNIPYNGGKKVSVPSVFSSVDKVVFLCNLKTHTDARFTGALKHSIGCVKLAERDPHSDMENLVPFVASLFSPSLCIIDARKVYVTEGPTCGEIRNPGFVLASTDRIALDVEGLKILKSFKAKNLLIFEPWDYIAIKRAIELGLGVKDGKGYGVVEGS